MNTGLAGARIGVTTYLLFGGGIVRNLEDLSDLFGCLAFNHVRNTSARDFTNRSPLLTAMALCQGNWQQERSRRAFLGQR